MSYRIEALIVMAIQAVASYGAELLSVFYGRFTPFPGFLCHNSDNV